MYYYSRFIPYRYVTGIGTIIFATIIYSSSSSKRQTVSRTKGAKTKPMASQSHYCDYLVLAKRHYGGSDAKLNTHSIIYIYYAVCAESRGEKQGGRVNKNGR